MSITRLAFVTDNHFDTHSRFAECVRVHDWIAEDAALRECSGTILGGDMFERADCATERNAVARWLLLMARFGDVIGIYGNHETQGALELFNLIGHDRRIHFHDRPAVDVIDDVAIACLPWPRKAQLLASAGDVGSEEVSNLAQHHLRAIMRGLATELDQMPPEYGRLALAHVMIDGAKTDHDQPITGADMAVSLQDLGLMRASFYACGHVHAQQVEDIAGAPCIYGGSPRHNNFGEPGPKGYTIIEFDGPKLVNWYRVATPATPMWLLSARWFAGNLLMSPIPDVRGGEVRLRFEVPADEREAAGIAAAVTRDHLIADLGALSVKLEPQVITTKRARAPEVARALTIGDKLEAHWKSISFDPADRREALLSKANHLEELDRNAS